MAVFRAVNTQLALADPQPAPMEDNPPATPRAFVAGTPKSDVSVDSAKTPTRESFAGMAAQKPLPELPTNIASPDRPDSNMGDVKAEAEAQGAEQQVKAEESSQDVEMTDSKDGKEGSEHDSADGESGRPSKKKKGQRFFCTDFPPCTLSFTRSEHLARHIRKHTGERPFQCHCNRRFSRLDNLRQHAQTVHVNEEIPIDSLAATGTRFQRQIRTDRVRPANRSRASTFSTPNPVHAQRGHSRNLSSSSVTSLSSVSTTFSGDEIRRGALGFETPRTNRLSLDTYVPTSTPNAAPPMQPYYTVGSNSPTGYSTPTSASFSVGNSSPRFSSGLHSPASSASRGLYWGSKTPSRRLSVPGTNPFQSSQSPDTQSSSYMSPGPSNAAIARTSNYVSTPSGSSIDSRRESLAEAEWRRRTWHPNTDTQLRARPATSHVTPQHIADLPRPVFPSQQSATQMPRLPGIHTFDQPPPPPSTLLGARPPSPMQLDPPPTSHPADQQPVSVSEGANNRVSWTANLQKGLNRLEITNEQQPQESSTWNPANPNARATESQIAQPKGHVRQRSDETPATPRKNKRMGWYMQPPVQPPFQNAQRPSPDSLSSDGAPTPVTTTADYHPAIVHSNGHVESHGTNQMQGVEEASKPVQVPVYQQAHNVSHAIPPTQAQPNTYGIQKVYEPIQVQHFSPTAERGDLRRLEALVAVATSAEQRI